MRPMETTTETTLTSEAMRSLWGLDTDYPVPQKGRRYTTSGKQDAVNALAAAVGVSAPTLKASSGLTVPKSLFLAAVEALGLPVDTNQSLVGVARDIALLGEVPWDNLCDSTAVQARNTSTITIQGIRKVTKAILAIKPQLGVDA